MRRGGSRFAAWLLAGVVGACGATPGGGGDVIDRSVRVQVHVGASPGAGVPVVAHHANGELVAHVDTDAGGVAIVPAGDDDLISVVVPIAYSATVLTTPVPAGDALDVRAPALPGDDQPAMAGTITIAAVPGFAASQYEITLGCTGTTVAALPATLEVPAPCLGSDANLDVLVEGYDLLDGDPPIPRLVGYLAGRAPFAAGHADFAAASWQATPPTIPIAIDDGIRVWESWNLWVDGLPFALGGADASAPLWSPLAADGATLSAELDRGIDATTATIRRRIAGVPGPQRIAASDFLASPPSPIAIDDRDHLIARWAADPGADAADVVQAAFAWQGAGPSVRWSAVLRPGMTSGTFPRLPPELAALVSTPLPDRRVETDLRYLESSELDGFDDVQAAPIDVTSEIGTAAIVPDVTSGQVRVSHAIANL